jgi:hypothetical protein
MFFLALRFFDDHYHEATEWFASHEDDAFL